ncbi:MAG: HlyD family efflux transporter periplasmic adaptor subunit [Oscillospiraceae bacterium]
MKKYLKLSVATLFIIVLSTFIPEAIENMVTSVELISPQRSIVSEDVYTNGVIEEISKKDIFVELPIVPEKVNVQIGDYVQAQDVIASVDTAATQAALFNLADSTNLIPQEYMAVIGKLNVSEQMIKDYIPTEIVSPTSGTVTSINLIAGAMATPKTTVCTISKTDVMRVKMTIDEIDADEVRKGDVVVFKASATGDVKYTGKIERVFPTATKTIAGTSQVTVVGIYVALDANYSRLKPGYSVNGVVKKQGDIVAMTIPYEAILQDDNNQEYIYVYEGGRAIRKNITTGEEFPDKVQVTFGIEQDDKIIINVADIKGNNAIVKNVR